MSLIKIAQIFQKYRSHLKVLGTRRVTCSKFRTEDTQILGNTVKKFSRPSYLETGVLGIPAFDYYMVLLLASATPNACWSSVHLLSLLVRERVASKQIWFVLLTCVQDCRTWNSVFSFSEPNPPQSDVADSQSSLGNVTFFIAASRDKDQFEFPLTAMYASNTLTFRVGGEVNARNSPQCWAPLGLNPCNSRWEAHREKNI